MGERVAVKQRNVWIVHGEDAVLVQEKKAELLSRYFKGDVPEPTVLESGAALKAYRYALDGQSLFSSAAAVIAENPYFFKKALRKDDEKDFAEWLTALKALSEETFVVLTAEGKPDKRLKATKSLFALASDLECKLLKPEDAVAAVEERLYDARKHLAPAARAYLLEVLSSWTTLSKPFLMTECDKWCLMAGEEKEISKALLETALPDFMDRGIFRFFDKLTARDAKEILASADHVFTDVDAILKNTGFIASQFRKIKMLKEMERNHVPSTEQIRRLELRSSWALKALAAQAKRMTEKEAEDFLLALFQCQYALRRGMDVNIKDVLLRFCVKK